MERPGEKFEPAELDETDPFGIVQVFATHLELSSSHMRPEQAFEAATHATRAYINSYDFVEVSYKGSPAPQYRMVLKKSMGGDAMK